MLKGCNLKYLLDFLGKSDLSLEEIALLFFDSSIKTKESLSLVDGERINFDGQTVTHMLLLHAPQFLALEEPWVDQLL